MVKNNIKLLVLDLDGVITDGTVTISESGEEHKSFAYQDLDAVTKARVFGLKLAIVTAEDTKIVNTITNRFSIKKVIKGSKDKLMSIKRLAKDYNLSMNNICYVADGDRDALALKEVGLSFCPANGTDIAKLASKICLENKGGNGAVREVIDSLIKNTD